MSGSDLTSNSDNQDVVRMSDSSALITLDQATFAKMMLDYLGRKETLSLHYEKCSFVLRLSDISNFYHLLEQKIENQKNVVIDHFSVEFNYSDLSSRVINGINALNCFAETRSVSIVSVTLTWNIAIQFSGCKDVVNQKIELSFLSSTAGKLDGEVILSITHNNQAWAIEVLNLLKDAISGLILERRKILSVYRFLMDGWKFFTLLMIGVSMIFSVFLIDSKKNLSLMSGSVYTGVSDKLYSGLSDDGKLIFQLGLINKGDFDYIRHRLSEKDSTIAVSSYDVDALEDFYDSQRSGLLFLQLVLSTAPVIIGFMIFFYAKYGFKFYSRNSFVIVDEKGERAYTDYNLKKNSMVFKGVTTVFMAILVGVIVKFFILVFFK